MPIINLVYEAPEWWQPWANTLLYYDFENVNNNTVPNLWTLTWMDATATNVTFDILSSWKKVATYTSNANANGIKTSWTMNTPSNMTMFFWVKWTWTSRYGTFWHTNSNWEFSINFNADWGKTNCTLYNNNWVWYGKSSTITLDSNWHLLTWTYNSVDKNKVYLDKTLLSFTTSNWSQNNYTQLTWANVYVGKTSNPSNNWSFVWQVWCFGIEDKSRTQQEIADYYDQTKADYGL